MINHSIEVEHHDYAPPLPPLPHKSNLVRAVVTLLRFIGALRVLGVPNLIKFLAQCQSDRSTLFN